MNMIMDSSQHHHHHPPQQQPQPQQYQAAALSPHRADLHISTTPPHLTQITHNNNNNNDNTMNHNHSHNNHNNNHNSNHNNHNNDGQMSPTALTSSSGRPAALATGGGGGGGKSTTLKRSFDVAFLMMPDERIKQKQAEKQARLAEAIERHQHQHQHPTDLSPRSQQLQLQLHAQQQQQHQQQQHQQQLHLQHLHEQAELSLQEARRYSQFSIRSPRIYDDPTVVIPIIDCDSLPLKSAFTKVASSATLAASGPTRLESPVQPAPPLSPDQLSCPSLSPPMATTPPRTNSGNGSLSNGSNNSTAPPPPPPPQSCLNPNMVYQSFRPAEYQFNGAFQSVSQVQAMQAQRLKQQLLYRPPLNGSSMVGANGSAGGPQPPPDFLPGYPGFPFPPGGGAHPFAGVAPPELPRIVQNPAAAAILSTLIPPTLASTFTLTAQNVCAKCNISFRMTSDLVYHMRSHHKSEVACDPNRRKREEKLKCPVCQESFRERHHLTRHMTAHQDKESDQIPSAASAAAAAAAANAAANHDIINVGIGGGGGGGSSRHHGARLSGVSK